jgi:uncharacterized protein YjiS (DUF1127 family)
LLLLWRKRLSGAASAIWRHSRGRTELSALSDFELRDVGINRVRQPGDADAAG